MRPPKGILKTSQSFEARDRRPNTSRSNKETKWDETNILATLHPPDKDYGHMKIDEPKTPYERDEIEDDVIDANILSERLNISANELPKCLMNSDTDEDSDDEILDPDEKVKRHLFELRRKEHYNEFLMAKLASKSLDEEEEMDQNDNSAS